MRPAKVHHHTVLIKSIVVGDLKVGANNPDNKQQCGTFTGARGSTHP